MKELPLSIGVISFVAGLVLLIAAIAGQKIEIAIDTGYCEGRDCISPRAHRTGP